MKKKFRVELFYEAEYPEIEAENEDEAFEQALDQWFECLPNVVVRLVEEEEKKDIACNICSYYYKDEGEESPRCHYEWDDRYAPCEIDDFEEEEEDD